MKMSSRHRNCYDTSIIYLFIIGKESILPNELIAKIPASTKATWKTYSKDKFIGSSQQYLLDEGIRSAELYQKYKHIKKVLRAVELIYMALSDMLSVIKIPIYQVKENKNKVLDLIFQYKDIMGLTQMLHIFSISKTTYHSWLLDIKVKCSSSYFEQCTRRYGTQLLKQQVSLIKETLTDDAYKHWPISSIAYYFQRKGLLQVSLTSWYKYARLLGINRKKVKGEKKYARIPCTKPNEYWHVDITYYTTSNNVKHCIYFLSDNYSRKILAWRLALQVRWTHVRDCIADAYLIASKMEQPLNLKIVSDGGPENIHSDLKKYVSGLIGNIKKAIALKDITYSNAPAETKNRTLKSYYLDSTIVNTQQLYNRIAFYVDDVNNVRPSAVLNGFTPSEVYTSTQPVFDFRTLRKIDTLNRKQENTNTCCRNCELI